MPGIGSYIGLSRNNDTQSGIFDLKEQQRFMSSLGWGIVSSGLVLNVDASNTTSYPRTGTTVNDLSSSACNFSSSVFPTFTSGPPSQFAFNGSTNTLIAPENSALNSNSITVEVWLKTNNTNQNGFLFEKGQVNTQYSLFQNASDNVYWRTYLSTGQNDLTIVASNYLSTTAWKQVVGTYTSGTKKIHINGSAVATGTPTGTVTTNANGASIGVYGGYNGSRGYYLNGNIGEVRVYNIALTDTQVLQNFNARRAKYGV